MPYNIVTNDRNHLNKQKMSHVNLLICKKKDYWGY